MSQKSKKLLGQRAAVRWDLFFCFVPNSQKRILMQDFKKDKQPSLQLSPARETVGGPLI